MSHRVLGAADIKIHLPPVIAGFPAAEFMIVFRVHITQEIPAAAGITGHGVGFVAPGGPFRNIGQGSFPFRSGFITVYMRQFKGQRGFIHRNGDAIDPLYGKGLAPVALPAEGGVAHFIIHFSFPDPPFFHFADHHIDRVPHQHPVEEIAVLQHRFPGGVGFLSVIMRPDDIGNGYIEMPGELMVPFIPAGHGHDGARAITRQYIFRDPDGNFPVIKRVDRVGACKHTADLFFSHPLAFTAAFYIGEIGFHLRFLRFRYNTGYDFMFRGDDHKIYAEDGIGAGGVYAEHGLIPCPLLLTEKGKLRLRI